MRCMPLVTAVHLWLNVSQFYVQHYHHHHSRGNGNGCARYVDGGEQLVGTDEGKGMSKAPSGSPFGGVKSKGEEATQFCK